MVTLRRVNVRQVVSDRRVLLSAVLPTVGGPLNVLTTPVFPYVLKTDVDGYAWYYETISVYFYLYVSDDFSRITKKRRENNCCRRRRVVFYRPSH